MNATEIIAYVPVDTFVCRDHFEAWRRQDVTSVVICHRPGQQDVSRAELIRDEGYDVYLVELSADEVKAAKRDLEAVALAKREQWTRLPGDDPWPELQPLIDAMPPAPTLTREMLPPDLSDWVFDIAYRLQCAVDYPAVAALVALATVVGRKITIRPKQYGTWLVVPNLWAQIIGPPGVLKSPAVSATFAPLYKLTEEARKQHAHEALAYEGKLMAWEAKRDHLRSLMKAAIREGKATDTLETQLAELVKPDAPTEQRYLTNDATIEKLGMLLVENPNGLLIERDELTGLFAQMEMEGHEQDRAFYLEAWDGLKGKSIDRVQRGSLYVPHCLLSIIGTIQPGPLAAYLERFYGDGQTDGFIERFQLSVYPEVPAWTRVDAPLDREAATRAQNLFIRMANVRDEVILSFDEPAQELFWSWLEPLEQTVRAPALHPVLRSHFSKYRSLMPSLALLFQLALSPTITAVGQEATRLAIAWCEYLAQHARRMFWPILQASKDSAARRLAEKVPELVGQQLTTREIARKGWGGLRTVEAVEGALKVLEPLGWVRGVRVTYGRGGSRETVRWTGNPAVLAITVSNVGMSGPREDIKPTPPPLGNTLSGPHDPSRHTDVTDVDPILEAADEPPF